MLAMSSGVTPQIAQQAVERVTVPPLAQSPYGSWALVRGRHRSFPFLLVQTHVGRAGQTMSHYIFVSSDVLKAFGGNLKALMRLVQDAPPDISSSGGKLLPLELPQAEPASVEDQVDAILELMMVTKNRIPLIEPLLAAIVQGSQLIIRGAPFGLEERVLFIEGMLALLPPSARFGVTFTTHSLPSTQIDTQIRFLSDGQPPEDTVVFDWTKAQTSGLSFEDDYSRFIISQLRLDAELVIKHNTAMASIAGWRLNQGDKLADALGYASKRLRLDEALLHNQPANTDEVSKVLAEDPTLSYELQVLYTEHLLKLSLAMEDMQHASPVAAMLREHPELARIVLDQMDDALQEGKAWLVYDALADWLSYPDGPKDDQWYTLTHRAALDMLQELVGDNDVDEINLFLEELQTVGTGVGVGKIILQIVEETRSLYPQDAQLARNLFLLAVKYLDAGDFAQLMDTLEFRDNLPSQIRRIWALIHTGATHAEPSKFLVKTSEAFGEDWYPTVLLRFAELACEAGQFQLLASPTLAALLDLTDSSASRLRKNRVLSIAHAVEGFALANTDTAGRLHLLQIHLTLGDFEGLAQQMLQQSRVFYSGDRQSGYLRMVEKLFADTPIPEDQVSRALQVMSRNGIRSVPFIIAAIGAIRHHADTPKLGAIADQVSAQLLESDYLVTVIEPSVVFGLFKYYIRRKNLDSASRVAIVIAHCAIHTGTRGFRWIVDTYKELSRSRGGQTAALKTLRIYVRNQDGHDTKRKVIAYLSKELGQQIRRPLETTYLISTMMGQSDILGFAEDVHDTVQFLHDTAGLYVGKRPPSAQALTNALRTLPGGFGRTQRRELGGRILTMAKAIAFLGTKYLTTRPRNEVRYVEALLKQQTNPKHAIDILWVMSGYLVRAKHIPLRIAAIEHPLADHNLDNIAREVETSSKSLNGFIQAFSPNDPINPTADEVCAELAESLETFHHDKKGAILAALGADLQQLASLIVKIASDGDHKALMDSGLAKKIHSGKYTPKSTLEFYRYMYAYFSAQ